MNSLLLSYYIKWSHPNYPFFSFSFFKRKELSLFFLLNLTTQFLSPFLPISGTQCLPVPLISPLTFFFQLIPLFSFLKEGPNCHQTKKVFLIIAFNLKSPPLSLLLYNKTSLKGRLIFLLHLPSLAFSLFSKSESRLPLTGPLEQFSPR